MNESEKPEVEALQIAADAQADAALAKGEAQIVPSDRVVGTIASQLPVGVQPSRNYMAAVELGHVLAASGYYSDARDPAKAAVKVMVGMDIGISPTAALQGIHVIEKDGRVQFLIEGKLFAAVIKARPGYDYTFVERTDEKVVIRFTRDGEVLEPDIDWDMAKAQKAGLTGRGAKMFEKYPREMLTWKALAEGTRAHFPEIIAGQPIYALEEFGMDANDESLKQALEPPKPTPLADEKAEALREKAQAVFDELKAINPDRLVTGRFTQMIAGAEHSHARLEAVLASLEDLRNTEASIAGLAEVLIELVGDKEAKPIIDRAERRGSQRERISVLENAVAEVRQAKIAEATPSETGGESDG